VLKECRICEHTERAVVEEALIRGAAYRELTRKYKVAIGAMKRHRKGHMNGAAPRAGDEEEQLE
jgi:hypothetical protein